MADGDRGWTEPVWGVLEGVCHSPAPFWLLLPWSSQMCSHFTDEDTETQRVEPVCLSVSKRQSREWSLTEESLCSAPEPGTGEDQTGSLELKATKRLPIHRHRHPSLGVCFYEAGSLSLLSRTVPGTCAQVISVE